jgi:Nif-specific regulatory protein
VTTTKADLRRREQSQPGPDSTPAPEQGPLAALIEVSRALSGTLDLTAALDAVLGVLQHNHGIIRSMITLRETEGMDLGIEAAVGLPEEGKQARFRIGEGITGRVVETGKPIVVPRISQEPRFLSRSVRRDPTEEVSFICTPILLDGASVGALAVDLRYEADRNYDYTLDLLRVVASMIAQAIKVSNIARAERQLLVEENTHLRGELRERYDFSNLIGNSHAMRHVFLQITQVAHTSATVLLRGESGTGKELIAHAIHYNSPRATKPLVSVNCAALPPTLIEAELFGYEKGAFTGAHSRKPGLFERADGGTLFLDEIGDLEPGLQVKLLRVLQQREVQRLGGTDMIKMDVRVIAATHRNLEERMAAGAFRDDLYYRLNVFSIFVPPLRERKADVLLLADHFVQKYSAEYGKQIKRISTPAIDMLMSYHWPGNIREMENIIVRAILVCDESVIHGHHLPPTLQTAEASGTVIRGSLADLVTSYERNLIEDALKTTRGNRAQASQLLQTTERILSYRLKQYGIEAGRYRTDVVNSKQ